MCIRRTYTHTRTHTGHIHVHAYTTTHARYKHGYALITPSSYPVSSLHVTLSIAQPLPQLFKLLLSFTTVFGDAPKGCLGITCLSYRNHQHKHSVCKSQSPTTKGDRGHTFRPRFLVLQFGDLPQERYTLLLETRQLLIAYHHRHQVSYVVMKVHTSYGRTGTHVKHRYTCTCTHTETDTYSARGSRLTSLHDWSCTSACDRSALNWSDLVSNSDRNSFSCSASRAFSWRVVPHGQSTGTDGTHTKHTHTQNTGVRTQDTHLLLGTQHGFLILQSLSC